MNCPNSLRPFFCYYGGKFRAAPKYPTPEYNTIVEPFAGAAGYSTRYPDCKIVLVERDPIIAGLWRYLTRVSAAEIRALPDMPFDGSSTDDLPVCQEARWLIGFWLNGGCASPRKHPSAWMKHSLLEGDTWASGHKAGAGSYWGASVRERIASQVDKIRHWQIIEGSYEQAPDVEATWFVDPPYAGAGKHYRFGASQIAYDRLAEWCVSRRGQTIVCENVGADWLPFVPFARIKANASKSGGKVSLEAIFVRKYTPAIEEAVPRNEVA